MDEEVDTCTCILGKSRKEIIIDGLRYSLIPIPAKRKEETLSDFVCNARHCFDENVIAERNVDKFIKQITDKSNYNCSGIGLAFYDVFVEVIKNRAGERFE